MKFLASNHNQKLLVISPIIFGVMATFFTYKYLNVFLLVSAALVAYHLFSYPAIARTIESQKDKVTKLLPIALVLVGSIGIAASSVLTLEKIELLSNADHVPTCTLSPIVACSPVIGSDQASAFSGMPNPVLGIFGFGALIIAGMSILAGGKFASWWWKILWLGTLAGLGFILWLAWQTLYVIGALCIYCMVAWAVTIAIFNYVTYYNVLHGHIQAPRKFIEKYEEYHLLPIVAMYAILIIMIYLRFDYYWKTLL